MELTARSVYIFIGLVFILSNVNGQEETECRGKPVKLNEKEKAQITDCLKENKIPSIWKIPLEKIGCLGVCILQKKNMLTDDGKINHEKALKYIDDHMPDAETRKLLIDAADKCIKEHGEKVKADNDPACTTFHSTGMCIHEKFLEICTSTS